MGWIWHPSRGAQSAGFRRSVAVFACLPFADWIDSHRALPGAASACDVRATGSRTTCCQEGSSAGEGEEYETTGCTAVGDGFRCGPCDHGRSKDARLLLGRQPGELHAADQHDRHVASTPLGPLQPAGRVRARHDQRHPGPCREVGRLRRRPRSPSICARVSSSIRARRFKPTRDFNADDVLFSFNRKWKDDIPITRSPAAPTTTSTTWACRTC